MPRIDTTVTQRPDHDRDLINAWVIVFALVIWVVVLLLEFM